MSEKSDIPDTYNGKSTRYELFDGYRHAGGVGKAVYIVSALFSALIVPALFELNEYTKAKDNAEAARSAMKVERAIQTQQLAVNTPDLSAGVADTKFRDSVSQRAAGAQPPTQQL